MKTVFFTTGILLWAMLMSCGKTGSESSDDPNQIDENDDVFPVININKPAPDQVFAGGDSIIVEGNATDNKVMYKGKVQLKNDATGLVVVEQQLETHFLQTLNFRVAYKTVVTASSDFTVIAEFTDHGSNTVNKTFKVKVNP